MRNGLDSINLDCAKGLAQRDQLYQKRMKLEAVISQLIRQNRTWTDWECRKKEYEMTMIMIMI
jgi:hypothetical protein